MNRTKAAVIAVINSFPLAGVCVCVCDRQLAIRRGVALIPL